MAKAVLRAATEAELAKWDELVTANPDGGNYLQTQTWAGFKASQGFKPHFLVLDGPDPVAALALERRVSGFGPLWYFSKGPGVVTEGQLKNFTEALHQARPEAFFARIEPPVLQDTVKAAKLAQMGLKRARTQVLKATIIVDISLDEESLINFFKQKTRYNIRLAARKGVTVEPVEPSQANLNKLYDLMAVTESRASGYRLHSREYFLALWQSFARAGQGQLFFASYQGQVLVGLFAVYLGKKGWYKDGGSIREHSNVMAPYLMQWEVMRWLKAKGVTSYDLVGVAPRDQAGHHSMDSLLPFKSGFNQEITEWIGSWDLPLSSKFKLWQRGGERLAVAYHSRVRNEFLY